MISLNDSLALGRGCVCAIAWQIRIVEQNAHVTAGVGNPDADPPEPGAVIDVIAGEQFADYAGEDALGIYDLATGRLHETDHGWVDWDPEGGFFSGSASCSGAAGEGGAAQIAQAKFQVRQLDTKNQQPVRIRYRVTMSTSGGYTSTESTFELTPANIYTSAEIVLTIDPPAANDSISMTAELVEIEPL